MPRFDLAIVGGGIIGLAHAYAAARRGLRVALIERDTRANGASIRNFGFITVTGQERHTVWPLARRARAIWAEIAPLAGIAIEHEGLLLTARYPESMAAIEAFLRSEMGEGCVLLSPETMRERHPRLAAPHTLGALWSPHELRVESRDVIPRLASWLEAEHQVTFLMATAACGVDLPVIQTSRGVIEAERCIVCPGDDMVSLFPERIAHYAPRKCFLTMLRLADPGFRLPAGIMSDLGLVRYAGYADLPEAAGIKQLAARQHASQLAHGVHLIVVQSADGTLVVGDSHHYHDTPQPFALAETEDQILQEFADALGFAPPPVIERWNGIYSQSDRQPFFVDAPSDKVRIVMVTTGAGASISFGLAEQVIGDLYD